MARSPTSLSGKPPPIDDALHLLPRRLAGEALDHRGEFLGEFLDGAMHHVGGFGRLFLLQRVVEFRLLRLRECEPPSGSRAVPCGCACASVRAVP
jgi:hypothetical protein